MNFIHKLSTTVNGFKLMMSGLCDILPVEYSGKFNTVLMCYAIDILC